MSSFAFNYAPIKDIKTISIDEGITGIGPYTFSSATAESGTVLKLPSTITSFGWAALSGVPFDVVDISEVKTDVTLNGNTLNTVIIGENNTHVLFDFGYNQQQPEEITISCKSTNLNTCSSKISKGMWCTNLKVVSDYYKGYDNRGNLIEEWDENGKKAYSYDFGGNLIAAYQNGKRIFGKRIYTPSEATAAVSGNKNTFSIIYR